MANSRDKAKEEAYNKGQADGNSYEKSSRNSDALGLAHCLSQLINPDYKPPNDPDEKEAYDKGFKNRK